MLERVHQWQAHLTFVTCWIYKCTFTSDVKRTWINRWLIDTLNNRFIINNRASLDMQHWAFLLLVMDDFKISKLDRFWFDFLKKINLDFEFRSEFLPFVEHFKYCEYWDSYKWNAQTSRHSRPNCASASPAYTLLSGKSARSEMTVTAFWLGREAGSR